MRNSFFSICTCVLFIACNQASSSSAQEASDGANAQTDSVSKASVKKPEMKVYKVYHNLGKQTERKTEEGYLINGVKQGLWKEYSNDGSYVLFEVNYVDDLKNGKYKYLYPDGKIHATGTYYNGCPVDTTTTFATDGTVICKQVWRHAGTNSSSLVWKKIYIKDYKQDGTIEIIDGKKYMWDSGERVGIKAD